MKVNHISVALYDNKPTRQANQWYDPDPGKEEHSSRFKLELSLLGDFKPQRLRCSLVWPPRDLRRLDHWQQHSKLYENWLIRARDIQTEIRAGRIQSSIPPLLGLPNSNQRFAGKAGARFSWQLPVAPSLIMAVQENTAQGRVWNITWLSQHTERVFVLDSGTEAAEVVNRRSASSTRLSRAYSQPGDIDADLFMNFRPCKIGIRDDTLYQQFRTQVTELFALDTQISCGQAQHLINQHPEFAERMITEGSKC